jgi:hypothetical protein
LKDVKCQWKSLPIKIDYITKCKWHKKGANRIQKCCYFYRRCVGAKCKVEKKNCKVTGKATVKRHKACYWKEFQNGRKQRCCSFSTFCKKKICRKLFRKCSWVGKKIWWKSDQKCEWKRKSKTMRQKRCCKYVYKCVGKKCKVVKTLCDWRGHPIYSKLFKNCRWVAHHKEGNKQFCCKQVKVCKGKKCRIFGKKCGYTGKTVQWKTKTTCSWAKFKDYKQRKCCYSRTRCVNLKNCRLFKESCKYIGPKVTVLPKKVCSSKKEGKGTRTTCCTFKRYCYGKHCKDINRKCKVGKHIEYKNSSKCFFEKVVKGWSRKVCCATANKCVEYKCKKIRRMCKVTDVRRMSKRRKYVLELRKKKYEHERIEKEKKQKLACDCFKQETQNYKVYEEKKETATKRFEKCKKKEALLKEKISKSKTKSSDLEAKLSKKGKKCLKFFDDLKFIVKKTADYKKFVYTKQVICTKETLNYDKFIKEYRFQETKYRTLDRKEERKERAVLVQKYESKELVVKTKVEIRESNIKKEIQKISEDCRRTHTELATIKKSAMKSDATYLKAEKNCKQMKLSFENQKKSLKKRKTKSNKHPMDKKRKTIFVAQKLITQERESKYLQCLKDLSQYKLLKEKSDKNFKNALKNHKNCSFALRKKKSTINRIEKREQKTKVNLNKLLNPKKKKVALPKPKKVAVVPKRIPRTRRGRGDVWLQDKNGNYIDVNVMGTFSYLRDVKHGIEIDAQFGQMGLGSVISGVSVSARNNVIKAERNGEVSLNGRVVKEKSAIFQYNGNTVQILKLNAKTPGLYIIKGLRDERLSFRYFPKLKSFDIAAESKELLTTGLFSDPANPKKYILSKKQSKFAKYVAFDYLDESSGNKDQIGEALKCCGKLKTKIAQENCKKDYYRTDVCFADEYTADLPLRK